MSFSPDSKESLFTDMQPSKDLTSAKTAELERSIVKPAREAYIQAANDFPLLTLFVTTLFVLSLFPILSFLGFCVFTGAIIIASSLAFFAFWTAIIIGSAFLVLVATLAVTFSISFSIVSAAAGGLLIYRLYANIRSTGSLPQGIRDTLTESKQYMTIKPRNARISGNAGNPVAPNDSNKHVNGAEI